MLASQPSPNVHPIARDRNRGSLTNTLLNIRLQELRLAQLPLPVRREPYSGKGPPFGEDDIAVKHRWRLVLDVTKPKYEARDADAVIT